MQVGCIIGSQCDSTVSAVANVTVKLMLSLVPQHDPQPHYFSMH